MDYSFIEHLTDLSPTSFLEKMVKKSLSALKNSQPVPKLDIQCKTANYTGFPIKLYEMQKQKYLYLLSLENHTDSFSIIPLDQVTGVSLNGFENHLDSLTTAFLNITDSDAPSKLSLSREIKDIFQQLNFECSFNLELGTDSSPEAHYLLSQILKELKPALQQIQSSDLGKESLREIKTMNFIFSANSSLESKKQDNTIGIIFGKELNLETIQTQLLTVLEKQL